MAFWDGLIMLCCLLAFGLLAAHWIIVAQKYQTRVSHLLFELRRMELHLKVLRKELFGDRMKDDMEELLFALRNSYLTVQIATKYGSNAQNFLGAGSRLCFLVTSDGRMAKLRNTAGQGVTVKTEDLTILAVYDAKGNKLPFLFNENGHIIVEADTEMLDYGPWKKYEKRKRLTVTGNLLPEGEIFQ